VEGHSHALLRGCGPGTGTFRLATPTSMSTLGEASGGCILRDVKELRIEDAAITMEHV